MNRSHPQKRLLIVGTLCLGIGLLLSYLFRVPSNNQLTNAYTTLPSIWFYAFAIIIGPLWEEMAYRFSQTKSNTLRVMNCILFPAVAFFAVNSVAIYVAACALIAYLVIQKRKLSAEIYIYLSTVSWAFLHLSADAKNILTLVSLIGVGLLLSFIRNRFSIIAAIVLHITWNAIIIVSAFSTEPRVIKKSFDSYVIYLSKNRMLQSDDWGKTLFEASDSITVTNALKSDIAKLLIEQRNGVEYNFAPSLAKYSGYILKGNKSLNIQKISHVFGYAIDSTANRKGGLILSLKGSIKKNEAEIIYEPDKKIVRETLLNALKSIGEDFEKPIEVEANNADLNRIVTINYDPSLPIEDCLKQVAHQLGVDIVIKETAIDVKTYFFY